MMTVATNYQKPAARFFRMLAPGATRGDIIAFFPEWDGKGEMFYIRSGPGEISEWCGEKMRWWNLEEMTPGFVEEMTEAEVLSYCPAATVPPCDDI